MGLGDVDDLPADDDDDDDADDDDDDDDDEDEDEDEDEDDGDDAADDGDDEDDEDDGDDGDDDSRAVLSDPNCAVLSDPNPVVPSDPPTHLTVAIGTRTQAESPSELGLATRNIKKSCEICTSSYCSKNCTNVLGRFWLQMFYLRWMCCPDDGTSLGFSLLTFHHRLQL